MVDPAYYYETEASESGLKPNLGWKDINEGDQREIKESIKIVCYCGNDGCSQNREVDTKIYDDRKIDSERRRKLRDDFPELYRWKTGQMGLKDKHKSLFPRCVYAYVLKSREWSKLSDCEPILLTILTSFSGPEHQQDQGATRAIRQLRCACAPTGAQNVGLKSGQNALCGNETG